MTTLDTSNLTPLFKAGSFVDDRGKRLMGKYMLGGTALGGSAALATSLMNYLATLKQQGDEATDTSQDDDVLYLTLKNKNLNAPKVGKGTANKRASIGGGLALTGGALATLGTYSAVRHLYQKLKKKKLQSELDDAQQQFFDVVSQEGAAQKRASDKSAVVKREGDEWLLYTKDGDRVLGRHKTPRQAYAHEYAINKSQESKKEAAMNPAGKPMGITELLTSAPVTMTLLAALASGALAHRALDRTFPLPKKNLGVGPKRVVLKNEPTYEDSEENQEEEDMHKTSAYDQVPASEQWEDALEFLTHTVLANTKAAHVSELRTMIGAIAEGRKDEFVHNMLEYGFDTAMDMVKGAEASFPSDRPSQVLAVGQCVKTAELTPVVAVLAAGEFEDMAPHFMKAGGDRTEEERDTLVKIAGVLGALGRNQVLTSCDIFLSKEASMAQPQGSISPELAQVLSQLIARYKEDAGGDHQQNIHTGDEEDPDVNIMTTESESSAGAEEGTHTEKQDNKPKLDDQTGTGHSRKTMEAPVADHIDKLLVGGSF